MTDRELFQQALETLEEVQMTIHTTPWFNRRIEAIRARLAQHQDTADKCKLEIVPAKGGLLHAQQEPVAIVTSDFDGGNKSIKFLNDLACMNLMQKTLLYTAPPQREWIGLTDDDINDHWITAMWNTEGTRLPIPEFARAIEAKLKEKNT